jgi:alpha-glucosidase
MRGMSGEPWWKGAAIYQIYPRSFADSNGDGVGDLPGIIARLNHVARLGVDAIWLSPFFPSPMRDFGYDVADYCGVDPLFGTLADFDALIDRAHALGLKVIIDQVYSHSSDQHPWFAESRSSRGNARSDWYVWADATPDGAPPNNWQSVFGGPAWAWDERRGQYYLHNFLAEQPDLNLHNRRVQDALLDVARFWLERGVDGFRLDAINFAMHDPELRDNPPVGHPRNRSHPDIVQFLERIRAVTDGYAARFTLAEVVGDEALDEMRAFTTPQRLDSAYGFDFLYSDRLTPALVASVARDWPDDTGWPSWTFENHDAPRAVSRWASAGQREAFAKMKMLLLCALRGTIIIYQGEELGLPQVEVPFEQLQDPEAIANWPDTLGRDGARTPMPWAAESPNLGFSEGNPWLPAGTAHQALAVDVQEATSDSMLHFTRRCLKLRAEQPTLRLGTMELVEAGEQRLTFERAHGGQRLCCTFNLGEESLPYRSAGRPLISAGSVAGGSLGPYAALVEAIA